MHAHPRATYLCVAPAGAIAVTASEAPMSHPPPPNARPAPTVREMDDRARRAEIARLYNEHGRRVTRWAARLAGPALEAEDIVQEVFLIAHDRLHTMRGESKVETWLYGITENVVRHRRRRERVRWLMSGLLRTAAPLHPAQPTPGDELERGEAAALVYRLLDGLREKYRTVFVLHEIEGLSWAEIAALTGTNESTLRVRLHRARALFEARVQRRSREARAVLGWPHAGGETPAPTASPSPGAGKART